MSKKIRIFHILVLFVKTPVAPARLSTQIYMDFSVKASYQSKPSDKRQRTFLLHSTT